MTSWPGCWLDDIVTGKVAIGAQYDALLSITKNFLLSYQKLTSKSRWMAEIKWQLISKTSDFWIVHSWTLRIRWCFLQAYQGPVTFLGLGGKIEDTAMDPAFKELI